MMLMCVFVCGYGETEIYIHIQIKQYTVLLLIIFFIFLFIISHFFSYSCAVFLITSKNMALLCPVNFFDVLSFKCSVIQVLYTMTIKT